MTTSVTAWNSVEGLPKQFVSSLRVLFDILDERNCGYIRLKDIESRWHDEGVHGLPAGVVDALRKVTPPSGYLSFDRFVAGLKLALLTNKKSSLGEYSKISVGNSKTNKEKENTNSNRANSSSERQPLTKPHGKEGTLTHDSHKSGSHTHDTQKSSRQHFSQGYTVRHTGINTAAVKPNNVRNHSGALQDRSNGQDTLKAESERKFSKPELNVHSRSPIKHHPSQSVRNQGSSQLHQHSKTDNPVVPPKVPPRDRSKTIIGELKNWQQRLKDAPSNHYSTVHHSKSDSNFNTPRDSVSSQDLYVNIDQISRAASSNLNLDPQSQSTPIPPNQKPGGTTVRRQNSARRHTLTNGVDYSMIKRMRQIEKEKEILLQGLEMVDKTREWYHKQIVALEEKQKYIGKTTFSDNSLEANQERMNFQEARISEVNQQLKTLVESSEKGFPLHINLAMRINNSDESLKMVKEQNKLLTQEVSQKGDIISKLEQEKAALLRDLFEAQAKNKPPNYDDTTFM